MRGILVWLLGNWLRRLLAGVRMNDDRESKLAAAANLRSWAQKSLTAGQMLFDMADYPEAIREFSKVREYMGRAIHWIEESYHVNVADKQDRIS